MHLIRNIPLRNLVIAAVFLFSGIKTNDQQEKLDHAACAVFPTSVAECKEECEIRFPDGSCKVDVKCLIRSLYHPEKTSAFFKSEIPDDAESQGEEHLQEQNDSSCRGKCLFMDKAGKCRLDLICILNRDVEGTLRFLREINVDAETAIHLSLSAGNSHINCKKQLTQPASSACSGPSEVLNGEGNCEQASLCKLHRSDNPEDETKVPREEDVSTPPFNDCPKKCQVRDASGRCVTDFDCARRDP